MSAVAISRISRTLVLTLDHAPVNGLGLALRTALADAFQMALDDAVVSAIVLTGAGRMFSAGADITEFGTPKSMTPPSLPEIINMIEQAKKPVVAAIHGNALGGGLELALGCAYRVAAPGANLGLPEVSLGIIPGAGGTQRLPRIIGVAPALDMIVSGKPIKAEKGLALGLIDELADGDLVDAAVKFCQGLPAGDAALRPTRAREEKLAEARDNPQLFDDYRETMARPARGLEAPYAAVECVEASVAQDFDTGLNFERETFKKLVVTTQSEALRHAFFVERGAAKIDGLAKDTAKQDIQRAAVIGCGTMGGGIAMNFANAGIPVTVLEAEDAFLQKGLETIRGNYAASVAKGRISQDKMDGCMALISGITDFAQLGEPDIVIEAIFEKMDAKKEVFAKLDAATPAETILATNTSTLDVNEIAAATKRPGKVIGTHFFSPANVMRLQENVRGAETSDETIATTMALAKKLGKVGVLVGVCDGFVGNRMLYAYSRQSNFLLEEGALPEQVDKAIYDFGFPMGPFAMGDLAGLDVGWLIRKAHAATRPSNLRYSPIADRICEMGRYGQKTSAGWYNYEKGSRVPIPDPEIEKLIVSVSEELGYERRPIDEAEIIQRCIYPLINEGANILAEGIAQRPGDIDTVWIYGYGFPRQRGGPMFYADTVGLKEIYDVMSKLYDEHGEWLKPAPLLAELAAAGKGFADL
ncbi:MAG TPA: 3-hydroxyacyl-CoA dehydrogenase [Alphaproteobacteria bacterium]|nr:3-hydroxyacyl-CoA dehydrogenase [Alphaproteobacteria bacterium]